MLATPTPTAEETRDNRVFEALLWAMSRPGLIRALPEEGADQIVGALVDRETRVFTDDPTLMAAIGRSGAQIVAMDVADHVFLSVPDGAQVLARLSHGSDLYPDGGATVVIAARLQGRSTLRMSGPGISGQIDVAVDGLPEGFWQMRARLMRYPMGVDLLLLDTDRVLGVPRSVTVEVL